jgi:hypothetical protein
MGAKTTKHQSPRRKTGQSHFPGWIELEEEEVSRLQVTREDQFKI